MKTFGVDYLLESKIETSTVEYAKLIKPGIFWLDELSQISSKFDKKNMQNLPKNPGLSYAYPTGAIFRKIYFSQKYLKFRDY